MSRYIFQITAILGALTVVIGAFGAHGLEDKLTVHQLNSFDTAVKYQFFHVFALLAVSILIKLYPQNSLNYATIFFLAGIILFSGSIYLLSCADLLGITSKKWIGPITPLGGLSFILGWIMLSLTKFS
ncbi:MAG: uncharacterized membrane protein YgdD (TMEM256/DUF423 family) [Sphingobacteriales bacterium]|jgi:uncharacterized membrane protein YgdD (TMEM256/DUF423 family)